METAKYKCTKCGKNFTVSDIKYSAGKIVCKFCLGEKHEEKPMAKAAAPPEEQTSYVCNSCTYRFKRKKSLVITACPYCGKEGTLTVKKDENASDLIKESLDRKYDF